VGYINRPGATPKKEVSASCAGQLKYTALDGQEAFGVLRVCRMDKDIL